MKKSRFRMTREELEYLPIEKFTSTILPLVHKDMPKRMSLSMLIGEPIVPEEVHSPIADSILAKMDEWDKK